MEYIQVTDENRNTILELFNKKIDDEGFIIDVKSKKRIVCPYTKEEIKADNFSILPGFKKQSKKKLNYTIVKNSLMVFAEHLVKCDLKNLETNKMSKLK